MSDNETPAAAGGTKPKSILQKLADGIASLAELKVVTGVGDVQLQVTDGEVSVKPTSGTQDINGIRTVINLVDGDISTLINTQFAPPNDPAVMDFHNKQVANAREIVRNNVEAITALAETASDKLMSLIESEEAPPEA